MTFTNDPPLISSIDLIPDAVEKADLDAPAGSGGKLVIGQAPNITITETSVVADAAERLALDVQEGDVAIQTNVSSSFIFTGGDNIAPNWEVLDFDAVGAIAGEDIAPNDINALGDILGQSIDVTTVDSDDLNLTGAFNGADTSAASAGEALTSDGSGGFNFASVGGIETAATFGGLPAVNPPQIGYVTSEEEYYYSKPQTGVPFDSTTANFQTSINSQGGDPSGIAWNNDGTQLYESDFGTGEISQYIVSTPFDISTASFETSINGQDNAPFGIQWNNDGSRLYEVGFQSQLIYEYDVSTPFDITTASVEDSISTQDSQSNGIAWNNNGTRLYEIGRAGLIYQSNLSTPFDISTATFQTSISSQDGGSSSGIVWNNDGSKLYEVGRTSRIFEYDVSTPFDITTATFQISTNLQDGDSQGIAWNNDGKRLYETGRGSGKIYQFIVSTGGWLEF